MAESLPVPAVPDMEPYSTDGLSERIKTMSRESMARMLQAGKHPIENAVPGSEVILIADTFSGEHHAALPGTVEGNNLSMSGVCSKATEFSLGFYDESFGVQVAGMRGECEPDGHVEVKTGIQAPHQATYMRITVAEPTRRGVSVVAFETMEPPPT